MIDFSGTSRPVYIYVHISLVKSACDKKFRIRV